MLPTNPASDGSAGDVFVQVSASPGVPGGLREGVGEALLRELPPGAADLDQEAAGHLALLRDDRHVVAEAHVVEQTLEEHVRDADQVVRLLTLVEGVRLFGERGGATLVVRLAHHDQLMLQLLHGPHLPREMYGREREHSVCCVSDAVMGPLTAIGRAFLELSTHLAGFSLPLHEDGGLADEG